MYEHVYNRFPSRETVIQALAEADPDFCSLLADYEEICTWLGAHRAERSPVFEEFETARELVGSIEREIAKILTNH